MANPYQGISKEEAVEKVVCYLLKFPESSRERVANSGSYQGYQNNEDDHNGEIYSNSINNLNLVRDAIGSSEYMELTIIALRYLEIHKKVEEIRCRQ